MSRTQERKVSKSEASKGAIMRAAVEDFTRRGYEGATIRDIAAAADASIGLIRYHFGHKSDLYRDTLAFVSEQYNEVCLEALAEAKESGEAGKIVFSWMAAPLTGWRDDSVVSGGQVLCFLNKMGYESPELTRDVYESHFSYAIREWHEAMRAFFPGMADGDWLWCLTMLRGMYFNIVAHNETNLWSLPAVSNKVAALQRLAEDAVLLMRSYDRV